jgi:hypothetical protein
LKVSYLPNIDLHDIQEKVISQREIHKCIPLYFVQNFYEYLQEFDKLCGFEDKLTKSEIETLYNFQDLCYEDFLLASIAHTTDKPRVIEEKSATEYKGFIGMSEDKRIDPTIVSEYNNWSFSEISMRMHVLGMIRSKLPEVYKVIKLESIRRASKFITCGGAPNPYIKGSHVIDIDNNLLTGITDYI